MNDNSCNEDMSQDNIDNESTSGDCQNRDILNKGFEKTSQAMKSISWESSHMDEVINDIYEKVPAWQAVKKKLEETSCDLFIYT